jgi:carbamoylphosphate synthase large subunit
MASPRALLIATSLSENGIGVARALKAVGFEVDVHAPRFHLLHNVHEVHAVGTIWAFSSALSTVARAVRTSPPDVIIPCDDTAVRVLHDVHRQYPEFQKTIESSLGSPDYFSQIASRANFLALLRDCLDVRIPKWTSLQSHQDLDALLPSAEYPLVLKREVSGGGACVRVVRFPDSARREFEALTAPPTFVNRVRRYVDDALFGVAHRSRPAHWRRVIAQQYVRGQAANRAVFCHQGKVLAGISVEVIHSFTETTPATVVRRIDHPEMEGAAAVAVERLKMSGFCGFDFVLEQETRRAWLLEMNPRLTAITHLPFGEGSDLIAAMAETYSGTRRWPRPVLPQDEVALFPKEMRRDAAALRNSTAYHDVPWEDPPLVSACVRRFAGIDSYGRIRHGLSLMKRAVVSTQWLRRTPVQEALSGTQ